MAISLKAKANWTSAYIPLLLLSAMGIAISAMYAANLRINWTPSEPRGIYQVKPISAGINRGDLIEFCYGGAKGPYMTRGVCPNNTAPFLKQVVGVPGDLVVVGDAGVMVNGRLLPESRPLRYSVSDPDYALPVLRGRFLLGPGQYWTYGSGMPSRSFDSRYFGAVDLASIRYVSTLQSKY